MKDLEQRLYFIKLWKSIGDLQKYLISAFFNPKGFLTGFAQIFAKKYRIPFNRLLFLHEIVYENDDEKDYS